MNKPEFETTDGGIQKGDLILVVAPRDQNMFPGYRTAFTGTYDPIDDADHWYVKRLQESGALTRLPSLQARLVGNVFIINTHPSIDANRLDRGVHDFSSGILDIRYERCAYVQLLLKASQLEQILYQH